MFEEHLALSATTPNHSLSVCGVTHGAFELETSRRKSATSVYLIYLMRDWFEVFHSVSVRFNDSVNECCHWMRETLAQQNLVNRSMCQQPSVFPSALMLLLLWHSMQSTLNPFSSFFSTIKFIESIHFIIPNKITMREQQQHIGMHLFGFYYVFDASRSSNSQID